MKGRKMLPRALERAKEGSGKVYEADSCKVKTEPRTCILRRDTASSPSGINW